MKIDSFDETNRLLRLVFYKTKTFRTILKYRQENYVKTPIYSNWKTESNTVNKLIRLDNLTLNTLNMNADPLVRAYCAEIILGLKNEKCHPFLPYGLDILSPY